MHQTVNCVVINCMTTKGMTNRRIPLSVHQTVNCVVINCMTNKGMTNGRIPWKSYSVLSPVTGPVGNAQGGPEAN